MAAAAVARGSKRFLTDVSPEYSFWVCDGRVLKNLRDLRDALAVMTEETYSYHVNEAKNDFHNWVKDIVGDDILANQLLQAGNTVSAARLVTDRIASLSGRPLAAQKASSRKPARR